MLHFVENVLLCNQIMLINTLLQHCWKFAAAGRRKCSFVFHVALHKEDSMRRGVSEPSPGLMDVSGTYRICASTREFLEFSITTFISSRVDRGKIWKWLLG